MQPEMAKLSLGKVCAANALLFHDANPVAFCSCKKNDATAATTSPPPALVPASALSVLVVNVQHGVLLRVVCWHVARQIDDNSLSPRKNK